MSAGGGAQRSVLLALETAGSEPRAVRVLRPRIGGACRGTKVAELRSKMRACEDERVCRALWDRLFEAREEFGVQGSQGVGGRVNGC